MGSSSVLWSHRSLSYTHIPPCDEPTDYHIRKSFYSIVVQAVVDYKNGFLDIYTGWPGTIHDAHMFAHSSLYKLGVDNKLLPDMKRTIKGIEVSLFLIGDFAYPLPTWLMKPFPHNDSLSTEQRTYNTTSVELT